MTVPLFGVTYVAGIFHLAPDRDVQGLEQNMRPESVSVTIVHLLKREIAKAETDRKRNGTSNGRTTMHAHSMVGRGRRCPVICERPGCASPACDDRCCREQEYGHRRGFRLHYGPNVSTFLSNNLQWTATRRLPPGECHKLASSTPSRSSGDWARDAVQFTLNERPGRLPAVINGLLGHPDKLALAVQATADRTGVLVHSCGNVADRATLGKCHAWSQSR